MSYIRYLSIGLLFALPTQSMDNFGENNIISVNGMTIGGHSVFTNGNRSVTFTGGNGGITIINGVISGGGNSVITGDNSITVVNGSQNNHKKIHLVGSQEKKLFSDAIHTVCLPGALARVIIENRDNKNTCIECDQAISTSGLQIVVKNGCLEYSIPQNSSIEFLGTYNKPLFTIYAHLINNTLSARGSANVQINTPFVNSIEASGASNISSNDQVANTELQLLSVSGSSKINMPLVQTEQVNVDVSGESQINIQGTVKNQLLNLSGTSQYNASQFRSLIASVNVSGCSSATLCVDQMLNGHASGVSTVLYSGNAQNNVRTSGMSSCRKLN